MAEAKWIKIVTDIFDDEKILLIENLPDSDAIIVIWFKLLCLAGKQNNHGVFLMNDRIAYTDKMLASIFRRKESTVQLALQTFEQLGMIEIVDDVITIPNWGKHQNLDKLEERKDYMRNYMQGYREKQKQIACKVNGKVNSKVNCKVNVNSIDIDKTKKENKESEGEEDDNAETKSFSFPSSSVTLRKEDLQRIVEAWNSIGLSRIARITTDSARYRMLKARVKEYGVDGVIEAIRKIPEQPFLMGKGNKGWTISFEWFVKPNNFPKVLEGNYMPHNTQERPQENKVEQRINNVINSIWEDE